MRFVIEQHPGPYGTRHVVVDTARGVVLLPSNYSPDEATYMAQFLNARLRQVPREPARPTLAVVTREGRPALRVIPGGAA